jgi:hypothetical protein
MERTNLEHIVFNFNLQPNPPQANIDGINYLIAVTQMKADQANEDAKRGADKQRDLVKAQKNVRERERALEMLRELEAIAASTNDVVEHVKAVGKFFQT